MSISKELWQQIEEELKGIFGSASFKLDGHEISIERRSKTEGMTVLCVFIDGKIEYKFIQPDKHPSEIHSKVWRTRKVSVYSPKEKQRIYKEFGKRKAKEYFPNLEKKGAYLDSTFNTALSLVRQFKKLEGLEVVKVGVKTAEELIA